jgi:hypothetical protein
MNTSQISEKLIWTYSGGMAMLQKDFLMREIENLSKALAHFILQKDANAFELFDEEGNISEKGFLYHRLKGLILEKKINEAENLLFDEVKNNGSDALMGVAVQFYKTLLELDDATLFECDFSRQEILEGLESVQRLVERD